MIIHDVASKPIRIPLVRKLGHSQKTYTYNESIIVGLRINNVVGVGEGCPRYYVTGEWIDSAIILFESIIRPKLINFKFERPEEVSYYLDSFLENNPALKAAIDIATFDAIGKIEKKPVHALLGTKVKDYIQYDEGIPFMDSIEDALSLINHSYKAGVRRFKLKVGKRPLKKEMEWLQIIRDHFPEIEIKLDANCAWEKDEAIEKINKLSKFKIALVEEPIKAHNFYDLKEVAENTDIPLMVDESLVDFNDALHLIQLGACKWFNIRISKNGGFIKSKAIYDLAVRNGINVQIGAHYGETGVLEIAKRHLAFVLPEVKSYEGGTNMALSEDVTTRDVKISKASKASLKGFSKEGLGIILRPKHNPFNQKC